MVLSRTSMIATALLASACASNVPASIGPVTGNPQIEYRGANPGLRAQSAAKPQQRGSSGYIQSAPVPPPRVVDMGASTSSPAVAEAQAMQPESGMRPGGALVQPRDNPAARRISVQAGDTLYDISRRYSVNMRALIETNRLEPPYALNPGSIVNLPPPNIHRIERGDTLYSVSRRYNIDTRSLALLNGMARPWTVYPGDELLLPPLARDQARSIPAPTPVRAPPPKPVVKAPAVTKPLKQLETMDAASGPISLVPGAAAAAPVAPVPKAPSSKPKEVRVVDNLKGSHDFIWPVSGSVSRGYGAGDDGVRNDGVNIDVPRGTPVKAAASGEVVYAGDELVGFGNLVLIRHSGGWITAYAYSDSLKVKEGDMVAQGQAIAISGATGNAGSPQVHFELRKGKEPVDPADYLPALKG
jgi:murein DD-endopeptidase MepM/ murein hydrolase activator NlpD